MRIVNADEIINFPFSEDSGTEEQIQEWISECQLDNIDLYLTEDCPIDIDSALEQLCKLAINGMINVIKSAQTQEV